MLLVIDNYDSFTYNLVQYFGELGEEVAVFRNDKISLTEVAELKPDFIVISPGPCDPDKAGISVSLIREFAGEIPILGVCLGHQSIASAFGGKIVRAERIMHGKTSFVHHDFSTGSMLFKGLPSPLEVGRYHSLIVEAESLPSCFEVTARTAEEEIMAIRHKEFPLEGIQFHPESVLTPDGMTMLKNFLTCYKEAPKTTV